MAVFGVFNQDEVLFGACERIEGLFADYGSRVERSSYQQRRHCYVLNVGSESDVVRTNGQPHDGLYARFRRESPGRASASDSKGSDSSPRVAHHADTRHVHAFSEPLGKGIQDSADVMRAIGQALADVTSA